MATKNKSTFDTVGGRRFIVTMFVILLSFIALGLSWLKSPEFKEICNWALAVFIGGNTLEIFRGGLTNVAAAIATKTPQKPQ